jgi:hypothetical protein
VNSSVDRILLGDNPFIGVNHLSQERSRGSRGKLDSRYVAEVIDSALTAGAQGLVCSAHPVMKDALNYMREENYSKDFGIYLIVPDAQSYVRRASEKGVLGLLNETFGKLSLKGKAKAVVGGGLSALTSDPTKMMKTYLEAEVSLFSKSLPKNARVKSVFLHELLTELIISFKMRNLVEEYIDFMNESLNAMPGFVTRNFPRFVDFALSAEIPMQDIVVMTPFNKVGFQMNPSKGDCEQALFNHPSLNVIAMSVLASGYVSLASALEYIKSLNSQISCVVGVSTEEHARETFPQLRTLFYGQ